MNKHIKASGNILREFSERIPSYYVALNELIKNAYDAGASKVEITFDSQKKLLTISDDGDGMDSNDIDELLHIAKSSKNYGNINPLTGRIIQGSKGLGAISVFKFGKHATWHTQKEIGLFFELSLDSFIDTDDIQDVPITIAEKQRGTKGTTISISISDDGLADINDYFLDERENNYIVYSFYDTGFDVRLIVDGNPITKLNLSEAIDSTLSNRQLYNVRFDSIDKLILYNHNHVKAFEVVFETSDLSYRIRANLTIFALKPNTKKFVPKVFLNHRGELSPLIYFNTNLIANYDLFNPNVTRSMKTGDVLSQIIGIIQIESNSDQVNFNVDRTSLIRTPTVANLYNDLEKINILIQKQGSLKKKYLIDMDYVKPDSNLPINNDFREWIKPDFSFKEMVDINIVEGERIEFSVFNRPRAYPWPNVSSTKAIVDEPASGDRLSDSNLQKDVPLGNNGINNKQALEPSKIILNTNNPVQFDIPSNQIDATKYLKKVITSSGSSVPITEVDIYFNEQKLVNGIIPSQEEISTNELVFKYMDHNTGLVVEKLTLSFVSPPPPQQKKRKEPIIKLFGNSAGSLFDVSTHNLIAEINKLGSIMDYPNLIACALRAVFELNIIALRQLKKTRFLSSSNELADQVKNVLDVVCSNPNASDGLTNVAKSCGESYNNLKNMIQPTQAFFDSVKKSHIGAHSAGSRLSTLDLEDISQKVAIFTVIVNEILKLP